MRIGRTEFDLENGYYIMGILNVTPDSFSDGGRWYTMDKALFHAEQMIKEGADILDIGGESTRPDHEPVSESEEQDRVLPVIEAVRSRFDVPVSVDTYKSTTARLAVEAGADLINDVWGLKKDHEMAAVIAENKTVCCLMHNRNAAVYEDLIRDVKEDLRECLRLAKTAGIKKEKIILDPGIGFGKTWEQNLFLMNQLQEITSMGYPVLLGTSRKSMIGRTLDLEPGERVEGTIATTVWGAMKGCHIFRVHDVRENKRALLMTEAMIKA